MKVSSILKIVFVVAFLIVAAFLSVLSGVSADDGFSTWQTEVEKKLKDSSGYHYDPKAVSSRNGFVEDGSSQKSENNGYIEKFGIGKFKNYSFVSCCKEYLSTLQKYMPDMNDQVSVKFFTYDFNGDGIMDFVSKIESMCKQDLCPSYLFVSQGAPELSYLAYSGPLISGDRLGVLTSQTGGLFDVVFTGKYGSCVWKWVLGVDQDFMCVR